MPFAYYAWDGRAIGRFLRDVGLRHLTIGITSARMSLDTTDHALKVMLSEARMAGSVFLKQFGAVRPFGMFLTVDGDTDLTDDVSDDASATYDDVMERVRLQLMDRAMSGGLVAVALLTEVYTAKGDLGLAIQIQTRLSTGLYIQRAVGQGDDLVLEEAEAASSLLMPDGLCFSALESVPEDANHPILRRSAAPSSA